MSFIYKFTKRDLGFALLTGLITGTIAWRIFEYLGVPPFAGIPWQTLMYVVPILWVLGVMLGYFLGQWMFFFNQFGKFAAIGFTNAAVDFGVLNFLIAQTGFLSGGGYTVIKSVSFTVALLGSYVWNKYWAFRSKNVSGGFMEFGKFVLVTILSFLINVGVASSVVNFIDPALGFDAHTWANVGAVAGSAVALIASFLGFKFAVFRK